MKLRNDTRGNWAYVPPGGERHSDGTTPKTVDVRSGESRAFSKSELDHPQVKAAIMAGVLVQDKSGEPLEVAPSGKVKA
jgi:hypothetical protein